MKPTDFPRPTGLSSTIRNPSGPLKLATIVFALNLGRRLGAICVTQIDRRHMKKFLQCVLVLVSFSVLAEPQIDSDLLIADGANNVRRIKMQTPAVTQVSYNVNIQYPGVAIPVDKVRLLEKRGWRQCDGDKASWEHFGDYAIEPRRLVHQYQLSFAKRGEFMAIALQYLSALP